MSYGSIPECVAVRVSFYLAWTRGYTALSICVIISWYFKRNIVQMVRPVTCQVFFKKAALFQTVSKDDFWDILTRWRWFETSEHHQSYYSRSWGECEYMDQMSRRSPPITVVLEEAKVIRADPLGTMNVSTKCHITIKQASTYLRLDPSGAPADRAVAACSPALAWMKRL